MSCTGPFLLWLADLPLCCYLTLNFQVLFWLPAVLEFWSSELPAKSFALLVTVAT